MKNLAAHAQLEVSKRSSVIGTAKIDAAPSAAPAIVDVNPSMMSTGASQTTKDVILGAHVNEAIDHAFRENNGSYAVKGLDLDVDAVTHKASASAPNANAVASNAKNNPGKGHEKANDASSKVNENAKRDVVTSPADKKSTVILGSNRDDVLTGTEKGDQIDGGNGDDSISGKAGADTLLGGNGDDKIEGGGGGDSINGGNGNDYLVGGTGNDTLNGGNGDDVLVAGRDRDLLIGGNGNDLYLFTKDSLGTGLTSTTLMVDKGDTIDLTSLGLYQADGSTFSGKAGEMLVLRSGSVTTLLGDVNGDGKVDIEIIVIGEADALLDMLVLAPAPVKPAPVEPKPQPEPVDPAPVKPAPVEPAPIDPTPVEPEPQPEPQPEPVEPSPVDPAPVNPAPVEPEPVDPDPQPDPVDPAPIDPAPVDSAPVEQTPIDPAPVDPAPADPIQAVVTATAQEDRVSQLEIPASVTNGQEISSIRILEQPETGHVSVSPENGITLVMTDAQKGFGQVGFSYEVTLADNSVVRVDADVNLTPAKALDGWSLGQGYMLETDAKGDLALEHGDNHRKVFVSKGEHALTKEDIAAMEGTTVAAIDKAGWGRWLEKNPEYGATEDMPLSADLGMALWNTITSNKTSSHWLLFESGYEYPEAQRLFNRGAHGESELNPLVVTSYGVGEAPQLGKMNVFQSSSSHMVITGVKLDGAQALLGTNLLVDNVTVKSEGNFQGIDGLTIRRSDFVDIVRDAPLNDGDTWDAHINRISGTFIANSKGVRLESNLFDKNSWAEGYDYKLAATSPQPPSMYSHNLYIQNNNFDVTLVDNIIMRGASFGAQVRSGGFIEDNVFLDNNAAVNFFGGETLGNYTLMNGNVITSAGHKRVSNSEGALSYGIDDYGKQTSLIENIVAHLADPANAAEIAQKTVTHHAVNKNVNRFFDDTIVYKWAAGQRNTLDKNTAGLDAAKMDATTIQQFASQLLGKEGATIADLATVLRAQAHGQLDSVVDADLIIAFFREGFGLDIAVRTGSETLVFTPDERGDGMRWDNRLNWSTNDLPGTRDGDSVDLAGNAVHFGNMTVVVDDFDFGDFGKLAATSGKLTIDGDISVGDKGTSLSIDRAGQIWINGYRDINLLEIDVAGGRFANKGNMVGTIDMHVSDNTQALLAIPGGSFDLMEGSSLTIEGNRVKLGFDGHNGDPGVLRMHDGSRLSFKADAAGLSTLGEFRSGNFGKAPEIDTAIRLDGDLKINVSAWVAGAASVSETLIKADEIVGSFDSIEVIGMGKDRNGTIVIDYDADEFRFVLGPLNGTGTGEISTVIIGADRTESWSQKADMQDLWQALHDPHLPPANDPLSF